MYSASLMLNMGKNFISSEYVNLTKASSAVATIAPVVMTPKDGALVEYTTLEDLSLEYTQINTVRKPLEGQVLRFKEGAAYLTEAEIEAKYGIELEVATELNAQYYDNTDVAVDGVNATIDFADPKVVALADKFSVGIVEGNAEFTLTKELTKSDVYSYFVYEVAYTVTSDNDSEVEVAAEQGVLFTKELVTIDFGTISVPWTFELAESLIEGGVGYAKTLVVTAQVPEYRHDDLYNINQIFTSVIAGSKSVSNNVEKPLISIQNDYATGEMTELSFKLGAGYEFADNGETAEVWTVSWVSDLESITATTTVKIALGNKPADVEVVMDPIEFELNGTEGYFEGESEIVEALYAQYKDVLGYESDADKVAAFDAFIAASVLTAEVNEEAAVIAPVLADDKVYVDADNYVANQAQKVVGTIENAAYGISMSFEVSGNCIVPMYNFVHSPGYVTDAPYCSFATATPTGDPITSLTVDQLNLNAAFNLYKDNAKVDLAAAGLVIEYALELTDAEKAKYPGLTLVNNVITYDDTLSQVGVSAKVFVESTSGKKIEVASDFQSIYGDYVVKAYKPLSSMEVGTDEVVVPGMGTYTMNIFNLIKVVDDKDVVVLENGTYDSVKYADPATLFDITVEYGEAEIPEWITSYVTFDSATATVTFDNTTDLKLITDVVVKVPVKVTYKWGEFNGTAVVTFEKP